MSKSNEAFWWSLFSAGGVVAAFFVPVHILLIGVLLPLGLVSQEILSYDRTVALISHPLVRLYLVVLMILPFFHCAHRFRHTLYDLGLRRPRTAIAVLCYGLATAGTVAALVIILPLP